MPIKFPKFTRRKSAGNRLDAEYEPASQGALNQPPAREPDCHDSQRDSGGSGYGGVGVHQRPERDSGNTTGSAFSGPEFYANRFSSNSTIPSADSPLTPDDDRQILAGPGGSYVQGTGKPALRQSQSFALPAGLPSSTAPMHSGASPRRSTFNIAPPPRLETSLDTSAIFGDDMFDFSEKKDSSKNVANSVTPTAPRLASDPIIGSDAEHHDISPVPPPRSYDPGSLPTTNRLPESPPNPAYTSIYASYQHRDNDRPLSTANEYTPYSWDPAAESLLSNQKASNSSPRTSRNLTPGQSIPRPSHSRTDSLTTPSGRISGPRQNVTKRGSGDSAALKRHSAVARRNSQPIDEDAAIVASASIARHGPTHSVTAPAGLDSMKRLSAKVKDRDSGWEEGASSSGSSMRADASSLNSKETNTTSPIMSRGNTDPYEKAPESSNATPKAKKTELVGIELHEDDLEDDFDPTISQAAALAARYEGSTSPPSQQPPPKVMTRAQFELYQKQQDETRRLSGRVDESDEDSSPSDSEEEEESEQERRQREAKQRAKQEAHLSVYRQQMMKVTGTEPSDLPALGMQYGRPASISTSALPLVTTSGPGSSGKDSEEEEDEEVPLGILMAHGFPNRNRPPMRLQNASSQPNLRASAQAQLHDPRLPPFARNLPADPYNIGASIINPTNRMSLAFGAGSDTRSNAGGSMYNGMPPSEMPGRGPQGLVGEIVKAEEMKAARKGHMQYAAHKDPFRPDPFARPSSPGATMHGFGGGMIQSVGGVGLGVGGGFNGQAPMMGGAMAGNPSMGTHAPPQSAGEQAQMQMQMAQMQHMMQMQMQFMQMQMQSGQQPQMQQPMLPPMMPQQRPTSMMSVSNGPGNNLMPPPQQPRAMSMSGPLPKLPQIPPFQQPGNRSSYVPSLAPSRQVPGNASFLGPHGYTASIAPSERSTLGQPSRYRPVSYAPHDNSSSGARTATLTSTGADWNRNKSPGPSHLKKSSAESDDDDDDGWAEQIRKREEKKKKKDTGLGGMLDNFGVVANATA